MGSLDEDNSNQKAIGWLLLVVNLGIIAFTVHQNRREKLFHVIHAIRNLQDLDATLLASLYRGASKIPLARVLLHSAERCLVQVEYEDEEDGDRCWKYLTKQLLPLRGSDGELIFTEPIPPQIDWISFAESIIEDQMKEKIHHTFSSEFKVIHESWCLKKGEINPAWKRRYLVLGFLQDKDDAPILMYFRSQEAAEQVRSTGNVDELALGSIRLSDIRAVLSVESRHVIELDDVSGRMWKFQFDSSDTYGGRTLSRRMFTTSR